VKILFDQGTPAPLRSALIGHEVKTAFECGWDALENGALLAAAEADGFEVFITADQNLQHQQNLSERRLAIVVLSTTNWPRIQRHAGLVVKAVDELTAGALIEVSIP
jgi:hypothetical protein